MSRPLPGTDKLPASGCYYNPASNGHGIDYHVKDGKAVIYWYTGRTTGEPRFMFATGEAGAEMDLYEIVGGSVKNPSAGVETLVGQCRFTEGLFTYRMDGKRSGMRVEPVVLSESRGIYCFPERKNEGISVQYFGDRCAVFLYTYRFNAMGVKYTDTWYLFEGEKDGKGYSLMAYETKGAFHTAGLRTRVVGDGRLVVRGSEAVFRFTIGNRSEEYLMELLF